ncbi:hypothetical protein TNCV_2388481 [Trichonephila clavipes]|nr:hypothetical protein TNCV_2388481 [Trichonephila clavipes]
MKTTSLEFISRSPTPSPMESKYRRPCLFRLFCMFQILLWYPWKGKKVDVPLRTAYSQNGRCSMQPKAKHSLRAQAQQIQTKTKTLRTLEKL